MNRKILAPGLCFLFGVPLAVVAATDALPDQPQDKTGLNPRTFAPIDSFIEKRSELPGLRTSSERIPHLVPSFPIPSHVIPELPENTPKTTVKGGQKGVQPKPSPVMKNPQGITTSVSSAKDYARSRIGEVQFSCLDKLFYAESKWNPLARNRSSGAYGIPQALPGSRMAIIADDWRTNPVTQVRWGLGYVKGRYGTACAAWNHFLAVRWY